METSVVKRDAPLQDLGQNPIPNPGPASDQPLRVLVHTVTHLVPGGHHGERLHFILNMVCQRHWNRDFDRDQERWNAYGDQFGYDNRNCYFLVDHGVTESESLEDPPLVWYKWKGTSLVEMQQELPAKFQKKLKKYPFQKRPAPPKLQGATRPPPEPAMYRKIIQSCLRSDSKIIDQDIEFLKTHPKDAAWLKNNIEPRFWSKIQSLLESSGGESSTGVQDANSKQASISSDDSKISSRADAKETNDLEDQHGD